MSRPRKNRLKKNKARAIRKARATRQRREGLRAAARADELPMLLPGTWEVPDGHPLVESMRAHCPICAGQDDQGHHDHEPSP